MNLVLGYNGFARVLGKDNNVFQPNPVVGAAAGTAVRGQPRPPRVRRVRRQPAGPDRGCSPASSASRSAGCCPAALLALVLVLVARGRAPRTDLVRAGAIVFGVWMLVDGLVLSYMKSMVHPYYSLSFAPGDLRHAGDRRSRDVGEARFLVRPRRPGRDGPGDGGVELVDARSQRRLASRTALGDPGRDGGGDRRPPGVVDVAGAATVRVGGTAGRR